MQGAVGRVAGLVLLALWHPMTHAAPCQAVAQVAEMAGAVERRAEHAADWQALEIDGALCAGDSLRIGTPGRALLRLANETVLRLGAGTTVSFTATQPDTDWWLRLQQGVLHLFSRTREQLTIETPFVNAAIDGTEFGLRVAEGRSALWVYEGRVRLANAQGELTAAAGQGAQAQAGTAPRALTQVDLIDAVAWALFYPTVLDLDAAPTAALRQAAHAVRNGRYAQAAGALEQQTAQGAAALTYSGALWLSMGHVQRAQDALTAALAADANHASALAQSALIVLVQGQAERATELAQRALARDDRLPAAYLALSYVHQAQFRIAEAQYYARRAVELDPHLALSWARLAELALAQNEVDAARESAQRALALDTDSARAQAMLGYVALAGLDLDTARTAFDAAVRLDGTDPLARLGAGLARIRAGELDAGRADIELAVGLDPANALLRSYLGKAYYEERREHLAGEQYALARRLDPEDPTPWYYDAIHQQAANRPGEALADLQQAIARNDHRAVYRSRLLLDRDLAARSASLARIYDDLGFEQRALLEGWRALNQAPAEHAAHRLLADSYASLPRHEIGRVSELFQAQLLQPININPLQPQLAESSLGILEGAGPSQLAYNEFTPLFARNRIYFQGNAVAGGQGTHGDDLVVSAIEGPLSLSAGQFHYETDGPRDNADEQHDVYNVFAQYAIDHHVNVQAEYRRRESVTGDLMLHADRDNFAPDLRQRAETDLARVGLHYAPTPDTDWLASLQWRDANTERDDRNEFLSVSGDNDARGGLAELLFNGRTEYLDLIAGAGVLATEGDSTVRFDFSPLPCFIPDADADCVRDESANIEHENGYVYALLRYPRAVTWVTGLSLENIDTEQTSHTQWNPKAGLLWDIDPRTTLRAAAFRVLKREFLADQTLEPTQVAGFAQFYDDVPGTDAWRYGLGLDRRLGSDWYAGAEFSRRMLDVPYTDTLTGREEDDWRESLGRGYLYWLPQPRIALRAEFLDERFRRSPEFFLNALAIDTRRLPLGVSYFHPDGFSAELTATHVWQSLEQANSLAIVQTLMSAESSEQFWVVDAALRYRLPHRYGIVSAGALNLFDSSIRYEETDPAQPTFSRERLFYVRLSLAF